MASRLPGRLGTGLLDAARAAFSHGLDNAALGAAAVMVLAAVLSAIFLRGIRVESAPAPAEEPQLGAQPELAGARR